MPRSYAPDDRPVEWEAPSPLELRLRQQPDAVGLAKEIDVVLGGSGSRVTVRNRIRNRTAWPVEIAVWALTILRGEGHVLLPQEPHGSHPEHLLPAREMVLWPYTDLSDPRWRFGKRWTLLHADPAISTPQKLGLGNRRGWAGYLRGQTLFVKRFPWIDGARYPDYGCNTETFTKGAFVELESLSPLRTVEPGDAVEHVEDWELTALVAPVELDDASLDSAIGPL
jgi:hypothetical protein